MSNVYGARVTTEDGNASGQDVTIVQLLKRSLDKAVTAEWPAAVRTVERHRARNTHDTDDQIADRIFRDYRRDMAAIGAVSGGVSAVPGPWSPVRIGGGLLVEPVVLFERSASMVLAVAHVYGHDLEDVEVRRHAILQTLSVWTGAAGGFTAFSFKASRGLGKKWVSKIPMSSIRWVNQSLGTRVFVKWTSKTGAIRLGTMAPFGIGVAIGGGGNYFIARGLCQVARQEFGPSSVGGEPTK